MKIKSKLTQLLYVLVVNDESIINDGRYIRDSINHNEKLLQSLFDTLENANFDVN